jgi:hypothetical protein
MSIPFETARGCWWGAKHHCTFCGLNGQTMKFRSKSPQKVLDEIRSLASKYQCLNFYAVDNIIDTAYFTSVLPSLKDSGWNITLFFETKANLKRSDVKALAEAGVRIIQPGIESLSSSVLSIMRKGVTALINIRLLKLCAEYDVIPRWNLLHAFPGETTEAYTEMAKLVPALSHLYPPASMGRLRIDRFSPYFVEGEKLGLRVSGPKWFYRYLYDVDDAHLFDLAYFSWAWRSPKTQPRSSASKPSAPNPKCRRTPSSRCDALALPSLSAPMPLAELIQDIHWRWRTAGFGDEGFPDLAARCLERSAPHRWLTLSDILDYTFDPDVIDGRHYNRCPDVLTLYSGPQFGVYAHLWLDAAVELHHHAWNGAFQVLSGSSVHARYQFTAEQIVQRKLRIGHMTCSALELLRAGDTVAVPAGAEWIHGLAYNERPSLALSIRATERPEQIRMEYWRPGLAIEAEQPPDQELLRRKAVLFVAGFDRREARERLVRWVASSDLRSAFHVLRFTRALGVDEETWSTVVDAGYVAHGERFSALLQGLGDHARIQQLQALRSRVHDPDLRLLLSGLCFGAHASDVLALVAARHPGDPARAVVGEWANRLFADDDVAQSILGAAPDPALRELFGSFVREPDINAALERAQTEFEIEGDEAPPMVLLRDAYDGLRRNGWLGILLS